MYYTRPRMSGLFYILGLLGLICAVIGLLIAIAVYFETRGVTKDDVKDAFLATIALGIGSFLLLGLASILNVLHDVRAELGRIATLAQAEAGPAGVLAISRAIEERSGIPVPPFAEEVFEPSPQSPGRVNSRP
jgi:hypothetical protein